MNAGNGKGIAWTLSAFDALTNHELYELLQLRAEVFVVEQVCAFQDLDGFDAQAVHLRGHVGGRLVAYARCFSPGARCTEASLGRIATRNNIRGTGLGHVLLRRAITAIEELWGTQAIRIGAQARLRKFYQSHGFVDSGLPYVEDGIDHLEMLWQPWRLK